MNSLITFLIAVNQGLLSVTMKCIIASITAEKILFIHLRLIMDWSQNDFMSQVVFLLLVFLYFIETIQDFYYIDVYERSAVVHKGSTCNLIKLHFHL